MIAKKNQLTTTSPDGSGILCLFPLKRQRYNGAGTMNPRILIVYAPKKLLLK